MPSGEYRVVPRYSRNRQTRWTPLLVDTSNRELGWGHAAPMFSFSSRGGSFLRRALLPAVHGTSAALPAAATPLRLIAARRALLPHTASLHTLLGRTSSPASPRLPPWAACSPSAVGSSSPSLLHNVLSLSVRWKGGTHKAKAHSRPPRYRKKPKIRNGATQRGETYKLKSHKGALKRFYQLKDGTFMHKAAGKNHLMAGASRRRQTRRLIKHRPVTTKGIIKKLRKLMPYGTTMTPPPKYVQPLMWDRPEGWTDLFYAAKRADGVEEVSRMMKEAKARSASG